MKNEKKNGTSLWKRLGTAIMVIVMLIGMIPTIGIADDSDVPAVNVTTVADPGTAMSYETMLGGTEDGNRYAGRVWVDKSVYDTGSVTLDGNTVTTDDNFLVVYSALGSTTSLSATYTGGAPDVVIVLDNSASMANTVSGSTTRMASVIASANALIKQITAIPDARVAVVSYSKNATTLLPLDHYVQVGSATAATNDDEEFLTVSNISSMNNGGKTTAQALAVSTDASGSTTYTKVTNTNDGYQPGTNQQAGIDMGMKILANESDTDNRTPIVIVMTDGVADTAASKQWYSYSSSNYQHPADNTVTSGVILGTLLNAAYNVALIEDNYGVNPTVYTIGVDVASYVSAGAEVILNPEKWFAENPTSSNDYAKTAWTWYQGWLTNGSATKNESVSGNSRPNQGVSWTFDAIPSSSGVTVQDIMDNIYYTDSYQSVESADLSAVFDKIVEEINKVVFNPITDTVTSGGETTDVPLTYVDFIGDYMEVKEIKQVTLFGQSYPVTKGTTSDGTTTYVVGNGETVTHPVLGTSFNISEAITIKLIETQVGTACPEQELWIYVAEEALPAMYDQVVDNNGAVTFVETKAQPLRVYYTVDLASEVLNSDGTIKAHMIDEDYVAEYGYTFYTNQFGVMNKDAVNGDTHASFVASESNRYYYHQDNHPVYVRATNTDGSAIDWDEDRYGVLYSDGAYNTTALSYDYIAGMQDSDMVYTLVSFYRPTTDTNDGSTGEEVTYLVYTHWHELKVDIAYFDSVNKVWINGYDATTKTFTTSTEYGVAVDSSVIGAYLAANTNVNSTQIYGYLGIGSWRMSRLANMTEEKSANSTGTASIAYAPAVNTDSAHPGNIVVWLGNNGKLTLNYDPRIPTKTVTDSEGTDIDGDSVMVGDILTYTVTAENYNTESCTVYVTDTVPAGTKLVEGSITLGGDYDENTNTITWTLTDMAPGEKRDVSFKVEVTEAALDVSSGYITNTATVQLGENGPKFDSNTTTNPPQGKKVTDTEGNVIEDSVKVGDMLLYSIEFHNDNDTAATVTVTDKVPAGTTFVSAEHGGVYNETTNTVTWKLENVTANMGGVVSFIVEVNASAQTTINNTATIKIGENGPEQKTNTTKTNVATGNLQLTKKLADDDTATDNAFTFTLTESTGLLNGTFSGVEFENGKATLTIKGGETITIEGLPAGATIHVAEQEAPGWTASYSPSTVTIVAGTTNSAAVTVTNDYYAEPVHFQLKGTKTFSGDNFPAGTFTFRAVECDANGNVVEAPITVIATASYESDGDAVILFSERTFTGTEKVDRYYLISEDATTVPGVTVDSTQYLLHLVAEDNGKGNMVLTATLYTKDEYGNWDIDNGTSASNVDSDGNVTSTVTLGGVNFTNTYVPKETTIEIKGTKTLTGRYLKANEFGFQLIEGTSVIATATNGDGSQQNPSVGSFSFPKITITADDMGGATEKTFTYYIREVTSSPAANTTYDTTYFKVEVTVKDVNGQLKATQTIYKYAMDENGDYPSEGTSVEAVAFLNKYSAPDTSFTIQGTKNLTGEGADGISAGEFSFTVYKTNSEGTTMGTVVSVGATGEGTSSAPITFAPIGITVADMADSVWNETTKKYEKTFYYLVVEDQLASDPNTYYDTAEIRVTVKATYDPSTGTLSVGNPAYPEGGLVFTNIQNLDYVEVVPAATKTTTGTAVPDGLRFSFRVTTDLEGKNLAGIGMSMPTGGADNSIEFSKLRITDEMFENAAKNADGSATFTYYIRESNAASQNGVTYDQAVYKYEVTVKRDTYNKLVEDSAKYYKQNDQGEWEAATTVSFQNQYSANGHINLTASKTTNSTFTLKADDFEFRLQRLDENGKLVEGSAVNGTNDGDGKVSFATLNFSNQMLTEEYKHTAEDGTSYYWLFQYLMSEIKPDTGAIPGVSYSTTQYIVTIKLTLNGEAITAVVDSVYEAQNVGGVYSAKEGTQTQVTDVNNTGVTFTNTYSVQNGTEVTIKATKTLSGRALAAGEFGFDLSRYDATTKTWKNVGTAFNDANGNVSFTRHYNASTLSHLASGFVENTDEYTVLYRLSEINNNLGGVEYSGSVYYVKVVIVHDKDTASYTVKSGYPEYFTDEACENEVDAASVVFANSYDTNDVHFTPEASKVLLDAGNNEMYPAGFSFEVIEVNADGSYMTVTSGGETINKVVATGTSDDQGNVTFTNVNYGNETGNRIHYYVIQEVRGTDSTITYSTEKYYVKVEISDNGLGLLKIESVTYYSDVFQTVIYKETHGTEVAKTGDISKVLFTNHYGPGYIDLELNIDKAFQVDVGEDSVKYESYIYNLLGSEFDFQVYKSYDPANGLSDLVTTGTNGPSKENGVADITFGSIVINKSQLVDENGKRVLEKTFTYYVKEMSRSGAAHIGIDSSVIKVDVTVTDDGYGNLTAEYTYTNMNGGEDRVFTNTYKPAGTSITLDISKLLSGKDLNEEFVFILDGKEYKDTDKDGLVTITLDYTAQDMSGADYANGVYTQKLKYTLTEKSGTVTNENGIYNYDLAKYTVTVTLTDNGSGKLHASVEITDADGNTVAQPVVFHNTYKHNDLTVDLDTYIDATKIVKGTDGETMKPNDVTFTFTVYDLKGKELSTATVNGTEADGKTPINFKEFTFTEAGEYRYLIKETASSKNGYILDSNVWCVHILVRYDAKTGALYIKDETDVYTHLFSGEDGHSESGVQTAAEESPAFVNVYDPDDVTVTLNVTKELTGRDLAAGEFEFRLVSKTDGTIEHKAYNDAEGNVTFHLTYAKAGTYTYELLEYNNGLGGVTYDTAKHTVTVEVSDDGNGKLSATVVYDGDSAITGVTFKNTYDAEPVEAVIEAVKTLSGRTQKPGEFVFELLDEDLNPVLDAEGNPITAKNAANGAIAFQTLTFTDAGTYVYKIREVNTNVSGVTYDKTVYTVTVTVTDDGKGQLHVQVAYSLDTAEVNAATFANTYQGAAVTVDVEAGKTLTGKDLKAEMFTFTLVNQDDADEVYTAANDANGKIVFEDLVFTEAGTYTYTMTEVAGEDANMTYDKTAYTVIITVTDDGDGQLKAAVEYVGGKPTFQNVYKPSAITVTLTGTKTLTGRTMTEGEFVFGVVDADGNPVTVGMNMADGKIVFADITIDSECAMVLTVYEVDSGDDTIVYDNTKFNVTIVVTNVDGQLAAQVTYPDGGIAFVNEYEEPNPEIPDTGDDTAILLYACMLTGCILGLIVLVLLVGKKRGQF